MAVVMVLIEIEMAVVRVLIEIEMAVVRVLIKAPPLLPLVRAQVLLLPLVRAQVLSPFQPTTRELR